jgi:hypothetical protein
MKVRGLLPSLGAGGSLIAAALCALAVFGGVLAFRGDRPGTARASSGDLTVPAGAVRARTASSERLEDVIALARAAVAAPRPAAARRPVRPRSRTRAAPRPRSNTLPVAPQTTPVSAPANPATPAPAAPPAAATPAVPDLPLPPVVTGSGAVQHVVQQTRATAQPIVDAAPAPVRAPVEQVAETVEQVAGTVDHTVDGVTGTVDQTVDGLTGSLPPKAPR